MQYFIIFSLILLSVLNPSFAFDYCDSYTEGKNDCKDAEITCKLIGAGQTNYTNSCPTDNSIYEKWYFYYVGSCQKDSFSWCLTFDEGWTCVASGVVSENTTCNQGTYTGTPRKGAAQIRYTCNNSGMFNSCRISTHLSYSVIKFLTFLNFMAIFAVFIIVGIIIYMYINNNKPKNSSVIKYYPKPEDQNNKSGDSSTTPLIDPQASV